MEKLNALKEAGKWLENFKGKIHNIQLLEGVLAELFFKLETTSMDSNNFKIFEGKVESLLAEKKGLIEEMKLELATLLEQKALPLNLEEISKEFSELIMSFTSDSIGLWILFEVIKELRLRYKPRRDVINLVTFKQKQAWNNVVNSMDISSFIKALLDGTVRSFIDCIKNIYAEDSNQLDEDILKLLAQMILRYGFSFSFNRKESPLPQIGMVSEAIFRNGSYNNMLQLNKKILNITPEKSISIQSAIHFHIDRVQAIIEMLYHLSSNEKRKEVQRFFQNFHSSFNPF